MNVYQTGTDNTTVYLTDYIAVCQTDYINVYQTDLTTVYVTKYTGCSDMTVKSDIWLD